jgi:hypothetical protein
MAVAKLAAFSLVILTGFAHGGSASNTSGAFVRVSGPSWCAYDRLKVHWRLPRGNVEAAAVGLYDAGAAVGAPALHLWSGGRALGVQWTAEQVQCLAMRPCQPILMALPMPLMLMARLPQVGGLGEESERSFPEKTADKNTEMATYCHVLIWARQTLTHTAAVR